MVQRELPSADSPPLLELSTELELSSILTIHGALKIAGDGTLFFNPGLDARMMGVEPRELPLEDVRGLSRSHQGRRVVVQAESPLVLRGPGAYQAWLALQLLRDCGDGRFPAILVPAQRQSLYASLDGLLGIGRTGFGFAAAESPLFGALSTFWEDFGVLERFGAAGNCLHLHLREKTYQFRFEEAGSLLPQLRRRWLAKQSPSTGFWPAIRRLGTNFECGSLTLNHRGLLFVPSSGPARLLAKRGVRIHVREEEDCIRMSDDGEKWATFWVENIAGTAEALRAELRSPAWLSEARGVCDLSHIRGPCTVELAVNSHKITQKVEISGKNGCMQFSLSSDLAVEPWTLCTLDVAGAGGRRRIEGVILTWETRVEGDVLVTLFATAPLKDLNQRAHRRLNVEDRVGRCTESATRRVIEEAVLLDLSRGGAGLWLSREVPLGGKVELLLEVVRKEGARKRIQFFPVCGEVMHSRPEAYANNDGWRVGIRFPRLEVAVFDAGQRVWLQERRQLEIEP